ncbi:uncharacterized protein LOC134258809 [Saccostrea cucullata]|uniref:uncharacterized protein LOC134258809 n=1 Tax=Saccostrea cuccullata TaxID=36930 RepID=UPI002ED00AD9
MSRYLSVECLIPNCCRQIYLSVPNIAGVANVDFSSCNVADKDGGISETTVYFQGNKSSATFVTSRCCGGVMNVYLDIKKNSLSADHVSKASDSLNAFLTKTAAYEVTSKGNIPEVGDVLYGHWSFTITVIMICMALLSVICVGSLLYRRHRKTKCTVKEEFPDSTHHPAKEDSEMSETPRIELTNTVKDNYFVLEIGDTFDSDLSANINSALNGDNEMPGNILTSEYMDIVYETTEVNCQKVPDNDLKCDCVYNTLHQTMVSTSDATSISNYSHLSDFNKVYSHLNVDR